MCTSLVTPLFGVDSVKVAGATGDEETGADSIHGVFAVTMLESWTFGGLNYKFWQIDVLGTPHENDIKSMK